MSVKKRLTALIFHVKSYPLETCEIIIMMTIAALAIMIMLPIGSFPLALYSGAYIFRAALGSVMLFTVTPPLVYRFKEGIEKYTFLYGRPRRKRWFWITQLWFYFFLLRLISQPLYPPIFLIYLGLMLISAVFYVRLGR